MTGSRRAAGSRSISSARCGTPTSTEEIGILPAFGEFTGVAEADVQLGDQVFVVAGDEVMAVPVIQR
jgi:hypothetical protein